MTYRRKGEYAEAVDAFRVAATDASTREVVQADARLKAAEALLMLGASDAGQFQEAASEADKLVSDFGDSSLVPRARYVAGRALRLSGQDAAAAAALEALYNEGSTEPATAGYTRRACLEAGLEAAWCYLAAGETLKARELFGGAKGGLEMLVGSMGEADAASRQAVEAAAGEAAQGEGFCMLAGGQTDQALSFFERTTGRADRPAGARLLRCSGVVRRWPPRAVIAMRSCASRRSPPSSTPAEIGPHGPSSGWHNRPWPWATAMPPAPRASG